MRHNIIYLNGFVDKYLETSFVAACVFTKLQLNQNLPYSDNMTTYANY